MSTKLKFIDSAPTMEPEGDEFSFGGVTTDEQGQNACLLYTSPSPRDGLLSRMPSSA